MLHGGRLVRLGPPQQAITPESLRLVYGVEVDVLTIDRPDGDAAAGLRTGGRGRPHFLNRHELC